MICPTVSEKSIMYSNEFTFKILLNAIITLTMIDKGYCHCMK